jgi:fucose permease
MIPTLMARSGESGLAAAAYVCLFASGFSDNARGPLFPRIIETFHVSDTECSLLVVLGGLFGLPGSIVAGHLVARLGTRSAIRAMALLLVLGIGLVALAGVTQDWRLVPVGASVLGFGLAGIGVCSNCCLTLAAPPERRARALAALHVTYAVASLLVPLAIRWSLSWAPWWHILAAVASVPAGLLPLSFFVPDARVERGKKTRGPLGVVLPYAFVLSLFVVAEVSISVWLVLYANRTSSYRGELLLAGFFVCMGVARALGGTFLRAHRVRPAIVVCALASAAVVLLGLDLDAAFLPFEGLTVGILFPATVSALTGELVPEQHGPAIGFVSGAYSLALAGAHALVGHLSDTVSLRAALHLSPACAVLGVAIFLVHGRRRNS